MKYKLTAVLYFPTGLDLSDARKLLLRVWNRAENINVGTETEERSFYQLERCFHDEEPSSPCVLLQREEKEEPSLLTTGDEGPDNETDPPVWEPEGL